MNSPCPDQPSYTIVLARRLPYRLGLFGAELGLDQCAQRSSGMEERSLLPLLTEISEGLFPLFSASCAS